MNIIQKQADEFIRNKMRSSGNYKDFIDEVRYELLEYKKDTYKIEFVEKIIQTVKIEYDKHFFVCTDKNNCIHNKYYENTLFFLQEELEELEENLSPKDFNKIERESINEALKRILDEINILKMGQELTYNDLSNEFEELKTYYYLNKKNWLQFFLGKVSNMILGGVISETVSKEIVKILYDNYDKLIANT